MNLFIGIGITYTNFFAMAICLSLCGIEDKPFVKDSYSYIDLGVRCDTEHLSNSPIFGIGYRLQSNEHGFNASLRSEVKFDNTSLEFDVHYFHYFKPNIDKQFYVGIGPSIGRVFETLNAIGIRKGNCPNLTTHYWIISPQLILGKSYRSDTGAKRFFEAVIAFPWTTRRDQLSFDSGNYYYYLNYCRNPLSRWIPTFSLQYGWGF